MVGSRAYGLAGPGSDHDRRGVYAAPTRNFWRLASADSDLDLRTAHVLPAAEVLGLHTGGYRDGVELDVVSHDLRKFAKLLASPNGYVLEQLLSPLVVVTSPLHDALKALAPDLVSRNHAHDLVVRARLAPLSS